MHGTAHLVRTLWWLSLFHWKHLQTCLIYICHRKYFGAEKMFETSYLTSPSLQCLCLLLIFTLDCYLYCISYLLFILLFHFSTTRFTEPWKQRTHSVIILFIVSCPFLVTQSCPTLCNSMDCSPQGFSVHGILQARILKWVAIPLSRGSSWPKDQTWVSCRSPSSQADSVPSEPPGKPQNRGKFPVYHHTHTHKNIQVSFWHTIEDKENQFVCSFRNE